VGCPATQYYGYPPKSVLWGTLLVGCPENSVLWGYPQKLVLWGTPLVGCPETQYYGVSPKVRIVGYPTILTFGVSHNTEFPDTPLGGYPTIWGTPLVERGAPKACSGKECSKGVLGKGVLQRRARKVVSGGYPRKGGEMKAIFLEKGGRRFPGRGSGGNGGASQPTSLGLPGNPNVWKSMISGRLFHPKEAGRLSDRPTQCMRNGKVAIWLFCAIEIPV